MASRYPEPILPTHREPDEHGEKPSRWTHNRSSHHHPRDPRVKHVHSKHDRRLRGFEFAPNWVRNELIAFTAEFCGTFMFLFMAFAATEVANANAPATANNALTQTPNTSNLMYIALAFGFSLAVNVWAFFRISGGLFNPAVTLGMLLIGAIKPLRGLLAFVAQIISSICAAAVVNGLFPGPLNVSTILAAGTTIAQGLFIEMFLTAELIFVIFMLAAEKHKATFLAPIGIGLALFIAELTGVYFTGGSLNPARSFGPSVIRGFEGYHWIYWIGPGFGCFLAYGLYMIMKFSEYETVNPGQDFNEHETEVFKPPADPVTAADVARPNVAAEQAAEIVESVISGETPLSEIRSASTSRRARGASRGSGRPSGSRGSDYVDRSHGRDLEAGTVNGRVGSAGDTYYPDGQRPRDDRGFSRT